VALNPTQPPVTDDGTALLLRTGLWILLVGGLAALLTATVGGGIGEHGPHTNGGWLLLILAMMCLPFGTMLTVLGTAKWLRNRGTARKN
jgi:drug/metabolite transporter (DMT)-like permease